MPNVRTRARAPALILLWLLVGCGGGIEYSARGEAIAPDTRLEVELARAPGADGHWPVTVEVDRLPSELGDASNEYAVWAHEPGTEAPRLLGVLQYDRDARYGQLHSTTPHARLTVLVTLEATDRPSAPSDRVIARRDIVHDPS